jgi:DNA (cytosine-5)-methyltransferase 1
MNTTVGLFAGIGGIERGLSQAGFSPEFLCEIEPAAASVLRYRFPDVPLASDICHLRRIPKVDLLCAGFPCQSLSQAGRTKGIHAGESKLIREVFRLVASPGTAPRWILLENVPFMIELHRGRAMKYITRRLEDLGYAWAYRVVDSRAFGLPQRRKRVLILASNTDDPRPVLLGGEANSCDKNENDSHAGNVACGFYWTEGNTGLGWAVNAIPALKKGSKLSIPSPPAIWFPKSRSIAVPNIKDAERLQGLPQGWTDPDICRAAFPHRLRWQLVGNALSVPVAKWIGQRIVRPGRYMKELEVQEPTEKYWAMAGWGFRGKRYNLDLSEWPIKKEAPLLEKFLKSPPIELSARATEGFLTRARASSLRFRPRFLRDVAYHLKRMKEKIC